MNLLANALLVFVFIIPLPLAFCAYKWGYNSGVIDQVIKNAEQLSGSKRGSETIPCPECGNEMYNDWDIVNRDGVRHKVFHCTNSNCAARNAGLLYRQFAVDDKGKLEEL